MGTSYAQTDLAVENVFLNSVPSRGNVSVHVSEGDVII